MGLRFSLQQANVVAWLLSDLRAARAMTWGDFNGDKTSVEALCEVLSDLGHSYMSSVGLEADFRYLAGEAADDLRHGARPWDALVKLREFMAWRPWTALILPSGMSEKVDRDLCSPAYLRHVVAGWPGGGGIVLQLSEPPAKNLDLTRPFPAFKMAVAQCDRWPGLLVWDSQRSCLLSRGRSIHERAGNIDKLVWDLVATTHGLGNAGSDSRRMFAAIEHLNEGRVDAARSFHIIQLSDIHFGSDAANSRLRRLKGVVKELSNEYGTGANVLPVISGDIVDEPKDGNIAVANDFVEFINERFTNQTFFVKGNHDCNKHGSLDSVANLGDLIVPETVRWFDAHRIGVVGFDSCDRADWARGRVSERQLDGILGRLDERQDYRLVGIVHHHPIAVPLPTWLKGRTWWKFLGPLHELTVCFGDAERFLRFVDAQKFSAIMHGHKHIPRETETPAGIKVFGAGSATGMIETLDKRRLLSVNVLTLQEAPMSVCCRFHIEDVAGRRALEEEYVVRG